MSTTYTRTETFTRTDIAKAFEGFRTDLTLMTRSTGLNSVHWAEETAQDVEAFAAADYLASVHVILKDANGTAIQAADYEVNRSAGYLTAQRPGGCLWSSTPGGALFVVVKYSENWQGVSDEQKAGFRETLRHSWGPSEYDLSHQGMRGNKTVVT